jgi:hypothetical protein
MGLTISKNDGMMLAAGAAVGAATVAVFRRNTATSSGQTVNTKTVLNPGRYDGATFLEDCPQAHDPSSWFVVPVAGVTYPEKKVLISAPYLVPHMDRFVEILKSWNITAYPVVGIERMEEIMIVEKAKEVQFDGVICGDDRYTDAAFAACAPRLKIVSKWGTGIDSIDIKASKKYGGKCVDVSQKRGKKERESCVVVCCFAVSSSSSLLSSHFSHHTVFQRITAS